MKVSLYLFVCLFESSIFGSSELFYEDDFDIEAK